MLAGATNQVVGIALAVVAGVAEIHIDVPGVGSIDRIGRSRPVVVRLEARRNVISRG